MTPDGRGRLHQNGAPSQTYPPPLVVAAPERLERSKGRGDRADRSRALGAPSRARLPPRTPGRDHIQIPNSVDGHGQDSFPTPAGTDTVRSADVRLLRSGALDVVVVGAGEHLGGRRAVAPQRVPAGEGSEESCSERLRIAPTGHNSSEVLPRPEGLHGRVGERGRVGIRDVSRSGGNARSAVFRVKGGIPGTGRHRHPNPLAAPTGLVGSALGTRFGDVPRAREDARPIRNGCRRQPSNMGNSPLPWPVRFSYAVSAGEGNP